MSAIRNIHDQLRQQPRAMQWAVYAVFGLALFMIWDQAAAPLAMDFKNRADAIQDKVRQVQAGTRLVREFKSMKSQVAAIGVVKLPGDKARRTSAVQSIVNEILQKYSTSEESFGLKEGRVSRDTLSSVTGGRRLDALQGDLQFTSTPKVAAAIIAELEADPNIEFIRTIRINKAPGKKVKVRLTLEAWALSIKT